MAFSDLGPSRQTWTKKIASATKASGSAFLGGSKGVG